MLLPIYSQKSEGNLCIFYNVPNIGLCIVCIVYSNTFQYKKSVYTKMLVFTNQSTSDFHIYLDLSVIVICFC